MAACVLLEESAGFLHCMSRCGQPISQFLGVHPYLRRFTPTSNCAGSPVLFHGLAPPSKLPPLLLLHLKLFQPQLPTCKCLRWAVSTRIKKLSPGPSSALSRMAGLQLPSEKFIPPLEALPCSQVSLDSAQRWAPVPSGAG